MARDEWAGVDDYIGAQLLGEDPVLAGVLERNRAAGLPEIDVSPAFGRFLQILVQIVGARRVLEIGTLGGYSTIGLARGLAPGGRVVTLEYAPRHAAVARENLAAAGVADRVELRVGVVDAGERLSAVSAGVIRTGQRNAWLELVLDEGRNRHIRRLLSAFEIATLRLIRVAIGDLALGDLPKGAWRALDGDDLRRLGR